MDEQVQSSEKLNTSSPSRFISLRWRFLFPLFLVLLVAAMIGAYAIANNLSYGVGVSQQNVLLQSSRAVSERTVDLYTRQHAEAQRIAFTSGIPEALLSGDVATLHAALEGAALAAGLDSVIITDAQGREVAGLQRVSTTEFTDYVISSGTDLSTEPIVQSVLNDQQTQTSGLFNTPEGLTLYTAVPVRQDDETIGAVLVGIYLNQVLEDLQGSAVADIALYGGDGRLLSTTLLLQGDVSGLNTIDATLIKQTLNTAGQAIIAPSVQINNIPYRAVYFPFIYGTQTLGVVATFVPDNVPFATEIGRQITSLALSAIAGVIVIAVFVGITRVTGRIEEVTVVADALAKGHTVARTQMQPTDEIGALGHALDRYADRTKHREDKLRDLLLRQRRETSYLLTVIDAFPEGVVVQAMDGRVVLINQRARELLGSQRVFRSSGIHELANVVADKLGPALAPGIYALGDPQRVNLGEKMLSAQAAAILSNSQKRIGTVIALRDITADVRQEQAHEELLDRLSKDVAQPLTGLVSTASRSPNPTIHAFAREISRHAARLQQMIVDMHELTALGPEQVKRGQRPLRLETLVWAVANDWRQIAQAAGLTLHVIIEQKGLYVLGDELLLRRAIGNLVDNAIKYTPAGGALTVEIKDAVDGAAYLRIRDNGVGILSEDMPHIFTPFYRGTPTTADGQVIRVPGMGQGLNITQRIIYAHGGQIQVRTKLHVGTAVYFNLPLTAVEGYELPQLDMADMEGETVRLPLDFRVDDEL